MKRQAYIIIIKTLFVFLIGLLFSVQFVRAQDSVTHKKTEETQPKRGDGNQSPQTTPPNPNPTPNTPANNVATTPKTTTPYIIVGSLDEYNQRNTANTSKYREIYDTVKPYIADPSMLEIVTWDMPAVGDVASAFKDTALFSVKPAIAAVQNKNVLASLDSWKEETRAFSIPFQIDKIEKLKLTRFFNLPDEMKEGEKLYLYFEGIAWRTELKLNGKFLGINTEPFKPWIIPINRDWLRKEENLLEVSLSYGESRVYSPEQFLGIFRPVYLLNQPQLAEIRKSIMNTVKETKDSVAIFVPYYNEHRYIFDKFQAVRVLTHAKKVGIGYIYFLFPPDKELETLCKAMGFTKVEKLTLNQPVCWLNHYPYQATLFPFTERFWIDQTGYRTDDYGTFSTFNSHKVAIEKRPITILYVMLVFFPLIGIFLVKLLNPKFFYVLPQILIKPRLQIERFIEVVAGNQGLSYILQILRILMIALGLALVVDYIHRNNQWQIIGLAGDNALVKVLFIQKSIFLNYILKSIIVVTSWAVFRWFVIRTLSNLFKIHNMYEGLTNLELVAAYPLILIIYLPLVFLSFVSDGWHEIILLSQASLLVLYILRQIYVCYVGMGRLFKFSTSVKVIYIILSILLPYLITL